LRKRERERERERSYLTHSQRFLLPLFLPHTHTQEVWFVRGFVLQVKMEKEAQSGAQEEVLSVELAAPSAWKKLVCLSFSLSLSL
jgi:hypothetical protein